MVDGVTGERREPGERREERWWREGIGEKGRERE